MSGYVWTITDKVKKELARRLMKPKAKPIAWLTFKRPANPEARSVWIGYDAIRFDPADSVVTLISKGVDVAYVVTPVLAPGNTLTVGGLDGRTEIKVF